MCCKDTWAAVQPAYVGLAGGAVSSGRVAEGVCMRVCTIPLLLDIMC